MNQPIIPASVALQFNERVQNKIDPRLFLFCNYEPTPSYAISRDALYITAIQDLYKFSIDSNCVLNHINIILPRTCQRSFDSLSDLLNIVQNLRSVFDHNQSSDNGLIEEERLNWYINNWLSETLKSKKELLGTVLPENLDDFTILYEKLESISMQIIDQIDKFLSVIESFSPFEKEETIENWLTAILNWYSTNTKRELYMGLLKSAYISQVAIMNGAKKTITPIKLNYNVKEWIQNALVADSQQKKAEINRHTKAINAIPTFTNEQVSKIEKQCGCTMQDIKNWFEKQIEVLKIQCSKLDSVTNSIFDSNNFFFNNLPIQLRDTVRRLDIDKVDYSLLPLEFLPYDINFYFNKVTPPT